MCVATTALWVRSYFREDYVSYFQGPEHAIACCSFIDSSLGVLCFATYSTFRVHEDDAFHYECRSREFSSLRTFGVFSDPRGTSLNAPHWGLAAVLAVLPILHVS